MWLKNASKNCDFSKNCEKLEKSQFLLKLLLSQMLEEVEARMPAKPAISEGKWVIIRYLHYCATYKMKICCQNSFVKTSQTRLATTFDLVLF